MVTTTPGFGRVSGTDESSVVLYQRDVQACLEGIARDQPGDTYALLAGAERSLIEPNSHHEVSDSIAIEIPRPRLGSSSGESGHDVARMKQE